MTINELIELYTTQTKICANTDFEDKKSVKENNKAVDKMYKIIENLKNDFLDNTKTEFYKILELKENGTNVWAAVQLLEKIDLPPVIKNKALSIVKKEISENEDSSYGLKLWLDEWQKNKE